MTLHAIDVPAPAAERYLTKRQLAELMGVSPRTIERWVAEGAPSETWGIRSRRFLASRVLQWARTRGQETA